MTDKTPPKTPETPRATDAADTSETPRTPAEPRSSDSSRDTDPPKAHHRGAKPRAARRSSGGALWLLVFILVALPLAAGYGAWWVWEDIAQQRQQLQSLEQRLADQTRQLNQQSGTLEQLPATLRQQLDREGQQARRQQQEVVSGVERRMERLEQRLSRIASTDRDDWKLAEAEYLLRLANQRLVLERDSRNALALAETTDNILRELGHSDLLPIRRALARDIQALKLADQVDRDGIYLRLQALDEQLPELSMVEPMEAPDPQQTTTDTASSGESGTWQTVKRSFNRLLQRMSNHIRIRRHNDVIHSLPDPREQRIIRQQLQLLISQAQAALLRERADLYQRSLDNAVNWLEAHYTLNPQVESTLTDLRRLADLDIAPALPTLDETLARVERYSEERNRLSPRFQTAPQTEQDTQQGTNGEPDA